MTDVTSFKAENAFNSYHRAIELAWAALERRQNSENPRAPDGRPCFDVYTEQVFEARRQLLADLQD